MIRILTLLILLLPCETLASQSENIDMLYAGLKMFIGMIIVIGLMLLVYALNRRGIYFLKKGKTELIKIVEMRHVGGKKILCLVEVSGQKLLLGLGNDRIDLLHHFDDSFLKNKFEDKLQEYSEKKR